jgi:hypothetical protein
MSDTTITPAAADTAAAPTPFLRGRFALYELPDGGMLLAYRPEGEETDRHLTVPAIAVAAGREMAAGGGMGPAGMFNTLRAMMKKG